MGSLKLGNVFFSADLQANKDQKSAVQKAKHCLTGDFLPALVSIHGKVLDVVAVVGDVEGVELRGHEAVGRLNRRTAGLSCPQFRPHFLQLPLEFLGPNSKE